MMKGTKLIWLALGIFIQVQVQCQNSALSERDSLWGIWNNQIETDTVRLVSLQKLIVNHYLYIQPDSAFILCDDYIKFSEVCEKPKHTAQGLQLKGLSCYNLYKDHDALIYYEQSLKLYDSLMHKKGIAATSALIGNVYLRMGNTHEAIEKYQYAHQHYIQLNEHDRAARMLTNLGICYDNLGLLDSATFYYEKSLDILLKLNNQSSASKAMMGLGIIYKKKGNLIKAYNCIEESLTMYMQLGDLEQVGNAYNMLGAIFKDLGNHEKALEYYNAFLQIVVENNIPEGQAWAYTNLGSFFSDTRQYQEAMISYQKALILYQNLGLKYGEAGIHWNLADIFIVQNEIDSAKNHCMKAIDLFNETDLSYGIAGSMIALGNIYMAQDSIPNAVRAFGDALEIAVQIMEMNAIRPALEGLYKCNLNLRNNSGALTVLSHILKLRMSELSVNYFSLSENEKEIYFETLEPDFGRYWDFTLHFGSDFAETKDTSLNYCLQNKGITMKSSSWVRQTILSSLDSALTRDYFLWLNCRKDLSECYNKSGNCRYLEHKTDSMEKELIKRSGAFSDFNKIQNLDWQQVRDGLTEGEAAIEFVHFKSEIDTANPVVYAAFVVRPESEHPDVVRLCTEDELKEIIGLIQGNNLSYVERVYGKRSEGKKDLYQKIWQPLEPYLQNVKTVYYSPSGLLHKVSFAAICKDQDVYLSDVYNFRQMGSTGNLAFDKNMNFGELENFLLMGGVNYQSENESENEVWTYLPGSLTETDAIHTYLVKKKFGVNYFTGLNASEEIFKEKISSSSIVHIATHGFFFPDPEQIRAENQRESVKENQGEELKFRGSTNYANWSFVNNKNPLMRSGIVLAKANEVWQRDPLAEGEDGILTAQEVSNLDLRNTKLVVLSACETGLGDIKGSEGVFGLQRAFKMAGVKYLIMSLWQVPDKETSEFMILFYKNLIKLKDIPTAFQKTQKEMREKYDPYYWGAFVLIE